MSVYVCVQGGYVHVSNQVRICMYVCVYVFACLCVCVCVCVCRLNLFMPHTCVHLFCCCQAAHMLNALDKIGANTHICRPFLIEGFVFSALTKCSLIVPD